MGVVRYNGIGMVTEDEFNTGLAGKLDKPDVEGTTGQVLTKTSGGSEEWATIPSTGTPADDTMSDSSTNAVQNKVVKAYVDSAVEVIGEALDTKANKDGYYNQMTVGLAENLLDTKGQGSEQNFTFRTSCGDVSIADDGAGVIKTIKGRTLKWNALVNPSQGSHTGATVAADGLISISKTVAAGDREFLSFGDFPVVNGHIYIMQQTLVSGTATNTSLYFLSSSLSISNGAGGRIDTSTLSAASRSATIMLDNQSGADAATYTFSTYLQIIDLTDLFGAGNKPSTVAEFKALYPNPYYAYNAGTLLPFKGTGLKTVGFNQWDEQTIPNYWLNATGEEEPKPGYLLARNYFEVLPSTYYYIESPKACYIYFYDINKQYISKFALNNTIFQTSAGCYYVRFYVSNSYGTTYKHDICINLSWSGYRNGEYDPYWEQTTNINVIGKSATDANGNAIVPFADGVNGVGTVYDQYDGNGGILRWGVRAYEAGDESDATVITDGTNTVYPLATPVPFTWDEPINLTYKVADFGTEGLLPEGVDTNGVPKTAPLDAIIKYNDDFTRTLSNLKKNFISKESLLNMLAALDSAGIIGTFTPATDMVYDETNAEYDFTFTNPNEE